MSGKFLKTSQGKKHYRRFLGNRINSGWRKRKERKEKERRKENKRKINC
jgi:hypothetical protein